MSVYTLITATSNDESLANLLQAASNVNAPLHPCTCYSRRTPKHLHKPVTRWGVNMTVRSGLEAVVGLDRAMVTWLALRLGFSSPWNNVSSSAGCIQEVSRANELLNRICGKKITVSLSAVNYKSQNLNCGSLRFAYSNRWHCTEHGAEIIQKPSMASKQTHFLIQWNKDSKYCLYQNCSHNTTLL